jgi:hypothetical protein
MRRARRRGAVEVELNADRIRIRVDEHPGHAFEKAR